MAAGPASNARMSRNWLIALAAWAGCGFGDNGALTNHSRHTCGDSTLDIGEGCDDGNNVSGDGCSETCAAETANPVCGNGTREVGEACDDGNSVNADGCSSTCKVESVCGNGTRETGEACDDGNVASGDGCSPTCQVEAAGACSLVPQGGCSGGTPACDLDDDGSTSCRAVTSQGTSNNHCTTDTACKAGYSCVDDGTGVASHTPVCSRFCLADADCTGTGSRCVIGLLSAGGNPLNVSVCSNACDPYAQSGCPTGMGCVARSATAGDYTDCRYMGSKLDGQTCAATTDCLPGSACVGTGGNFTCHPYCIVGNNNTCDGGKTCVAFAGQLTIGATEYGACN
jgi:cysteine-rich repeat protein